jgi:hypothetical protein
MRSTEIVYVIISVVLAAEVSRSYAQQEKHLPVEIKIQETAAADNELSVAQNNEWIPGNFTQDGIIKE